MTTEPTPLQQLEAAVQDFINTTTDESCIVKDAVVVWESTRFEDNGSQAFLVKYAVVTEGTGLSTSVGLLELAGDILRADILEHYTDDDEE